MARGYFQTNSNEDKKLYCEWYTEADYEAGVSRVMGSVFIRYKSPLTVENGKVTVNARGRSENLTTISFTDGNNEETYTKLLYSGKLLEVKHKIKNPEKILLTVRFRIRATEMFQASGEILLEPEPQVYPVLRSRKITEIGQNSVKLTMHASHPSGIEKYIFSINGGEPKESLTGTVEFDGLVPDTYYIAQFQAVSNDGLVSPAETEIFKTQPAYIGSITYDGSNPIELHENETMPLSLKIKYTDNDTNELQFIGGDLKNGAEESEVDSKKLVFSSSNPQVAAVSIDGVIQGLSKGKCEIEISAAEGGEAKASIEVNVVRSIEYVHITNPNIQIHKSTATEDTNKKYRVMYSLYPEGANKEKLTFQSSNENIAEVNDDGVITVNGLGRAVITAVKLSDDNPDGEKMGTCIVDVVEAENELSVWQDLLMLPVGARWDYQIPDAINENLHYIQRKLGSEGAVELEDASFPDGFNTNIQELCYKLNNLELNIDKINEEIPWVSPYYVGPRKYDEYAPMREDINRWIQFCADIKSVIDGEKEKLQILSMEGEPLVISDDMNESLQYLCIREGYFTNGDNL